MVTISAIETRKNGTTQEEFIVAVITGEPRVHISKEGKASIVPSAVTSLPMYDIPIGAAQGLIGKKLQGSIERVECEPYTTENGTFTHRFQYSPKEEASVVQSAMPTMQLQMPKQLQGVPLELMNTFRVNEYL